MTDEVFIHPTSMVEPGAVVGKGTRVWQHCTILTGARIGESCTLSQNVFVEGNTRIGDRVKIKNNVSIYERVEIDDDVFIGPSAVFTNVRTPRAFWPRKDEFLPTRIEKGATIGANATILCGVTIGQYAMVGAGAVVTRDVIPFSVVYGVPARWHGWVCYCGDFLGGMTDETEFRCKRCERDYIMKNGRFLEKEKPGSRRK